jgi:hypothetical protein
MIVCEFCLHHTVAGTCRLGLNIPKRLTCREFAPGIEKFCADPKDFAGQHQIVQMASFFGFQKTELKKIKVMALNEENVRSLESGSNN